MCGRIAATLPIEAMAALFSAVPGNDLPQGENFNLCPSETIALCTSEAGQRRLRAMRWGFVPAWYKSPTDGPLLINARAETIAEKPAFRQAVRARRCLIPMAGFYEWLRPKGGRPEPWFISRQDGAPLVLAGIWQEWEAEGTRLASCAIVTTAAGPTLAPIHDREPVSLEPDSWPLWLGEAGKGAAPLMRPAPAGRLTAWRVGFEVNSNRATGPGLIVPLADTGRAVG